MVGAAKPALPLTAGRGLPGHDLDGAVHAMIVVFDMDNTLTDDFGQRLRPGVVRLLERLADDGFELALWTQSTRLRARRILADHDLERHFASFVFREDYDPDNRNVGKDIRRVDGLFLVDDDPDHVGHVKDLGLDGFVVRSFRGRLDMDRRELDAAYKAIRRARRRHRWWGWLRRRPAKLAAARAP
jgi:hypothetical protein